MSVTEQLTLSWGEAPASPSASRESERGYEANQGSCSSTYEQFERSVLAGLSGRTSRERSQARRGLLSDSSCQKWMTSGTVWRGVYSTRSLPEFPCGTVTEALPDGSARLHSAAGVSFLSEVLEANAPQKYSLSPTACAGVIRRAEKKGKSLPEPMNGVLRKVVASA